MATNVEAIRRFVHYATWLHMTGRDCQNEAAMVKLMSSRLASAAAADAMHLHGGNGFMSDCRANRHFREAQILEIGEGTTEIQQLLIARAMGC